MPKQVAQTQRQDHLWGGGGLRNPVGKNGVKVNWGMSSYHLPTFPIELLYYYNTKEVLVGRLRVTI